MMHTRCRQFLLLMVDFEMLKKEEEQVKKGWTYQIKIKFKTNTSLAEKCDTTIGSATNGGATTRICIFKSEPRYLINELPQLPRVRLWSNLKWASGRTHVFLWPRVSWLSWDLPLFWQQTHNHEETNAAIQGMLNNHAQWQVSMGHEMANLQQQQKSKLGGSVPAPPHPATSLSNHDNNQLGKGHPLCIQISIYFPFILLFLSLLYIFLQR